MNSSYLSECKICHSKALDLFLHTARCKDCGVLLYYPYPEKISLEARHDPDSILNYQKNYREWYTHAARLNHLNFTAMFLFAIEHPETIAAPVKILDYGAGAGQFATICKSFIPWCKVYSVDIINYGLLNEYRPFTTQIEWGNFENDETLFDYIFLNDVFEHINDSRSTLEILAKKLKPSGKLFIDTPKQFWLYPMLRFSSKSLYGKLLKGTVSIAHLQIWSRKSFFSIVNQSGFRIEKYLELSEFSMQPNIYLKNMGINNIFLVYLGNLFYRGAKLVAKNKIMCLLVKA